MSVASGLRAPKTPAVLLFAMTINSRLHRAPNSKRFVAYHVEEKPGIAVLASEEGQEVQVRVIQVDPGTKRCAVIPAATCSCTEK